MNANWLAAPLLFGFAALGASCSAPADDEMPADLAANPDLVSESIARYVRNASAPDSVGTGEFPAIKLEEGSLPDHVVYRPGDLGQLGGRKMPVYVYGNGACSDDGASQRQHLLEIASHGYLAIAAGRIYSGPGIAVNEDDWAKHRDNTSYTLLGDAIDWAVKENARPESPYFGKIDTAHVAVSGYSCGGAQALRYAGDPRVATFVIMNAGLSEPDTPRTGEMDVSPDMLDKVEVPILYVLGGPDDVAYKNGMADYRRLTRVPSAAINLPVSHQGTFSEPNGGAAARAVVAWLDWTLRGDREAAGWFEGGDCKLCADPKWTVEKRNLARIGKE